jgi:hypothetical protein
MVVKLVSHSKTRIGIGIKGNIWTAGEGLCGITNSNKSYVFPNWLFILNKEIEMTGFQYAQGQCRCRSILFFGDFCAG